MEERNVDLAKAYELISGGKVSNNGKHEINWQALTDEFLNKERGNRRETTKKDFRKRLDRTLQALSVKPIPRNSEQLFKNLILSENKKNFIRVIIYIFNLYKRVFQLPSFTEMPKIL